LILQGVVATYGSTPWNVGIYQKTKNNFNLICGGTLIAPNLVVSGKLYAGVHYIIV
jgi:modular serine protease